MTGSGAVPSAYLITFACYGEWLPGQGGAVDRDHNAFGSPMPEADVVKEARAGRRMTQECYRLDAVRRRVVLTAIHEVCSYRAWTLLAAHVRAAHVHVVVEGDRGPEFVMNTLKSCASRALNRMALDDAGRRRWARHGSTRHLWTNKAVFAAIHYVVCEQGEAMAVFEMEAAR